MMMISMTNSTIGIGTSESEVVELQRTQPNTPHHKLMFDHRKSQTRYRSYSTDMGMSWYGFAPVPALPDPGCKGGIAAWPAKQALNYSTAPEGASSASLRHRVRSCGLGPVDC